VLRLMETKMHLHEIANALSRVTVAAPQISRNLAVYPLTGPRGFEDFLLLGEALSDRLVTIAEVSNAGSVPTLLLENRAEKPVLLLEGEHLVGCKQNRVLNTSVLVPAGSKLEIPVSCVEQGRWHWDRSQFARSDHGMAAELRAAKVQQVSRSLREAGTAVSDQYALWTGIAAKAERMGSASASGAIEGIYEHRQAELQHYLQPLKPLPDQLGAVFAINGKGVGLELLPTASAWRLAAPAVVSGYALDALDGPAASTADAGHQAAQALMQRVGAMRSERYPGVGLGEDIRLDDGDAVGTALVYAGHVLHLCAFDTGPAMDPWSSARRKASLRRALYSTVQRHGQ
jgi:hypothetical protein